MTARRSAHLRPGRAPGSGYRPRPAYWPQFDGPARAHRGLPAARRGARRASSAATSCPPGWSTPRSRPRARPATASRRAQVDLVLCHAVTYATSSTVLPVAQAAGVPVVLLGLQPAATLDYANTDTGEWLANCAACCVPEIAGAFTRARHPVRHGRGHDRRRRARVGEDRRLGARRRRRARAAARADRLPRARLSGDARHVHRLHGGARAGRRARRGAGDRRPRRARGAGDRRRGRRQGRRRSAAMFAFADPSDDPIAGPIEHDSSTGRRASRSGSTGSSPTSSSTR